MKVESFQEVIEAVRHQYTVLDWRVDKVRPRGSEELMFEWPGNENEDVIVVIHHSDVEDEPFHNHDYFYFNYAYTGGFGTITCDHRDIFVQENEICAGQPFSAHAMKAHDNETVTIIGVLVRRDAMVRRVLPFLSPSAKLLRFLVQPEAEVASDKYFHIRVDDPIRIRHLLELMLMEYYADNTDAQEVLLSLTAAMLMLISQSIDKSGDLVDGDLNKTDSIVRYIQQKAATATLASTAKQFGYSPTYLSGLLKNETGKTFSDLITEERMNRAALLLKETDLSIENIANVLGYNSSSSFYRAHKRHFGCAPRQQKQEIAPEK